MNEDIASTRSWWENHLSPWSSK